VPRDRGPLPSSDAANMTQLLDRITHCRMPRHSMYGYCRARMFCTALVGSAYEVANLALLGGRWSQGKEDSGNPFRCYRVLYLQLGLPG